MKILRKTMLFLSVALLAAACDKDIEEFDREIPGIGETKTLSLSVPTMTGMTRVDNTASTNESAVDNVYVFQYIKSDGKLFDGHFQYYSGSEISNVSGSSNKTVSAQLDDSESTIFVVANLGNAYFTKENAPKTLTDFEAWVYKFGTTAISKTAVENGTFKLPMVGKTEIKAGATRIEVPMKRLVAKIGYTINIDKTTAPSTLKLTSVRLEYVPNQVSLAPKTAGDTRVWPATTAPENFYNKDTEFIYEEYTAADISGTEHIWYVPENLAGRNSSITAAKYKGGTNVPDKYCMRIIASGTVTYNGEPDTEVTFCIYPGGNSTTEKKHICAFSINGLGSLKDIPLFVQHLHPPDADEIRRQLRQVYLRCRRQQGGIHPRILRGNHRLQRQEARGLPDVQTVKHRPEVNIRHGLALGALLDDHALPQKQTLNALRRSLRDAAVIDQLHPAAEPGQLPDRPDGDIAVHGPNPLGHEGVQRLRQAGAVHVLVDLEVQDLAVAGLPHAQGQRKGNDGVGVEPLGVPQNQPLAEEHPLEGPQQVQMGDIHRPALLGKDQPQLTHDSTLPLPRRWPRSRCTGCGSRA